MSTRSASAAVPSCSPGSTLQAGALAWLAAIIGIHTPYAAMIVPFVMAGAGMALVFAPSAAAVLFAVRTAQAGQASGATNAIRETGGVLGVAVLASVFTSAGGYGSPQAFVAGAARAVGRRRRARARCASRCLLAFRHAGRANAEPARAQKLALGEAA